MPPNSEEMANLAIQVGADLISAYGKKKFHSKAMIDGAMRKKRIRAHNAIWAYALLTSSTTFAEICARENLSGHYGEMRSKMLSALHASKESQGTAEDVDSVCAAVVYTLMLDASA